MQFREHGFALGYCFPNMKNIAVREGTLDVTMPVTASSCAVRWAVIPTSDELGPYQLTSSDCTIYQRLEGLYNVNRSDLIIRNSTTSENGQLITTAGLYIAECYESGTKTGAKLTVVRK